MVIKMVTLVALPLLLALALTNPSCTRSCSKPTPILFLGRPLNTPSCTISIPRLSTCISVSP